MKPNFKLSSSIALAGGLLLLAPCAQATQFTWDGGGADGNWATVANWVGDTFAEAGSSEFTYLKFAGTTNLITNNNASSSSQGLNVGRVDFLEGAGAFTLNPQSTSIVFKLDMLGTNGNVDKTDWAQINNFSTNAQTINLGLIARPDFAQGIEFNTQAGNILVSGPITEALGTGANLLKTGNQTLTLSGDSSYTGSTTISAGILQVGDGGTLNGTIGNNNASNASIASGATLRIARTGTGGNALAYTGVLSGSGTLDILSGARMDFDTVNQTSSGNLTFNVDGTLGIRTQSGSNIVHIGELTGSGSIIRGANPGGAGTVIIGGKNTSSTFSGTISSAELGIEKTGTGTLTLSGDNSYSGATTVSGGALAVNGTLSNTSGVTIGTGGTLQGSGTINSSVTIESGGTFAPGNSIESIGAGNLSLLAGSTYAYELQTNLYAGSPGVAGDLTYSSGTLDIAPGAILTLTDLAASTALAVGSKLTLISYFGGWATDELFSYDEGAGLATLADDSTFTLGANTWRFDYNDTTGGPNYAGDQTGATSFVTMTVIPEPSSALLGVIGTLALLLRRRR